MAKTRHIQNDSNEALTESEAELWRRVTSTVQPLSGSSISLTTAEEETFEEMISQSLGASVQKKNETKSPKDACLFDKRHKSLPVFPSVCPASVETKSQGAVSGLNAATTRKLWRGKISIDAQIDLHGYGRIEAQTELVKFIEIAHGSGKRCLLVITGKGKHTSKEQTPYSGAEPRHSFNEGVLKSSFPGWMRIPDLQNKIISYCQAPQHLGGGGAWLIYLRKAAKTKAY